MRKGESERIHLKQLFQYTKFRSRSAEDIHNTLSTRINGSDTITALAPIDKISVEQINENQDKVTFIYDDYSYYMIMTWAKSENGFTLVEVE
jgi:hypothetical protein